MTNAPLKSAFQPLGPRQRLCLEGSGRRIAEGERSNARSGREEHARCCSRQGSHRDCLGVSACGGGFCKFTNDWDSREDALIFSQGFFSTQFIQWESRDNGTSSLVVTHEAWLLAAIAAPLTLFTLILWWVWTRLQTPRELGASRTLDLLPFQAILKRRRLKRQLSELE